MMSNTYYKLLVIFLFLHGINFAQNISSFSINDRLIKVIDIRVKQVALIKVSASASEHIKFKSSSESTYKNHIHFDYQIKNDTLTITDVYPKHLEFGDNKMTSMQEFSVNIELNIPENLNLLIDSTYASAVIDGTYSSLIINTKSGICKLNIPDTNANINTYNGDIYVKTNAAKVDAITRNGDLSIDDFYVSRNQLYIRTVDGNIEVKNI